MALSTLAGDFCELFAGLEHAHGQYLLSGQKSSKGKALGRGTWIKTGPATETDWQRHLAGDMHLGVPPLRRDGTCTWGAIDVDEYPVDHKSVAKRVSDLALPLTLIRSKSGGGHLFLFLTRPESAAAVRSKLFLFVKILGWSTKTEIFPKQNVLTENQDACAECRGSGGVNGEQCPSCDGSGKESSLGSWLNMPYQNIDYGLRYALDSDGNALSAEEFIQIARDRAIDPALLADFSETKLQADAIASSNEGADDTLPWGPPCLNALLVNGEVRAGLSRRSEVLFNLAIYYKKVFRGNRDKMISAISEINSKYFNPPVHLSDVRARVGSALNKNYQYRCNESPLVEHCDNAACKLRKFGIVDPLRVRGVNGASTPGLSGGDFGQLVRYGTDDATFEWTIRGKKLKFKAKHILNQREFRVKLMNDTGWDVGITNPSSWAIIVNNAMATLINVEVTSALLEKGQFYRHIVKFCSGRVIAKDLEEITSGKPFVKNGNYYFVVEDFMEYLREKGQPTRLDDIFMKFNEIGVLSKREIFNGLTCEYFVVPGAEALQTEDFNVPRDNQESRF
jgi:hypothetical protein